MLTIRQTAAQQPYANYLSLSIIIIIIITMTLITNYQNYDNRSETRAAYVLRAEIDTVRLRREEHAKFRQGARTIIIRTRTMTILIILLTIITITITIVMLTIADDDRRAEVPLRFGGVRPRRGHDVRRGARRPLAALALPARLMYVMVDFAFYDMYCV